MDAKPEPQSEHPANRSDAAPGHERLTRSEVAAVLGVSVATVRRMEGCELHPSLDAGVHRFDPVEVARLARHRMLRPVAASAEGELCARAFAMFDDGRSVREIVMTLRQPAERVARLFEQWRQMGRGELVLTLAHQSELMKVIGRFQGPADLIRRVQELDRSVDDAMNECSELEMRCSELETSIDVLRGAAASSLPTAESPAGEASPSPIKGDLT